MPKKPPPTLGGQLRAARIQAGLLQSELAEQLGCSQSFVGKLERCDLAVTSQLRKGHPNVLQLIAICRALCANFTIDDKGRANLWRE